MATVKQVFNKFIKELETASKREHRDLDRNELRKTAQSAAIHLLELNAEQKDLWNSFYDSEIQRLKEGQNPRTTNLEEKKSIVEGKTLTTFAEAKRIAKLIEQEAEDLNRKIGEYEIGHKDNSIAATRLALIIQYGKKDIHSYLGLGPVQLKLLEKCLKLFDKIEALEQEQIDRLLEISEGKYSNQLLLALLDSEEEITVKSETLKLISDKNAQLVYKLEMEDYSKNQAKGAIAGLLGKQVAKIFKANGETAERLILKDKFILELQSAQSSDSFEDGIEGVITSAIFGKRYKLKSSKNFKKTYKSKPVKAVKSKLRNYRKVKAKGRVPRNLLQPKLDIGYDILSLKEIINRVLANAVRDEMGEPNDPAIRLRYQTGRFSDSAKLLTLTRTQAGTIAGTYTYQRDPYDVFLPGGKLHTKLRDPRMYIESAIRGIAQELLKDRFPGISLGLS